MAAKEEQKVVECGVHPTLKALPEESNQKNLSLMEMIAQAFCLVFSLQRGRGLKRAADLLENNPKSVIAAGFISTIIFFTICFAASQLAIKYSGH